MCVRIALPFCNALCTWWYTLSTFLGQVCNRHLDLQLDFVNSDFGPLRLLSHVGLLSRIDLQLPALIREHFGDREADIANRVLNDPAARHRDRNAVEHKPVPPHIFPSSKVKAGGFLFRASDLSAATRGAIRAKYAVDVVCLAGIT